MGNDLTMIRFLALLFCMLVPWATSAQSAPPATFSTFASGSGPSFSGDVYRVLDNRQTPGQSNAIAFELEREGAYEKLTLSSRLRVLEGGDGGAFLFLNTGEYGRRGPAPYLKNWTEPNLRRSFAVGIDVHDPPSKDPYGPWGNYQDHPQREVSLHWDGREIVKRVSPVEFRGSFVACEIDINYVIGGADITVRLAGQAVFDSYFLAGMQPYEARLAIGAGTREDATTRFDVGDIHLSVSEPDRTRRAPLHFKLFNHALVGAGSTSPMSEVTLPPLGWAFGRVLLTLEIHDAGPGWDIWDRTGHLYLIDPEGIRRDISPFITSFRTPGRWQVDISHFRPWLTGKTIFELTVAGDSDQAGQFMFSAALEFCHGTPDREPFRIIPLWNGTARYRSTANHFSDFFTPRSVDIDPPTRGASLYLYMSGHTQVGEFSPARRSLVFKPDLNDDPGTELRFENTLWKTDNYLNPLRPQSGTWKYARAGWAPGDVVRPWRIDLSPFILPGEKAEVRYLPEPYDFSGVAPDQRPSRNEIDQSTLLVRTYLVLYRPPENLIPAPRLRILSVETDSNASHAGLQEDDYLVSYDSRELTTIEELRAIIRETEQADNHDITVEFYRGPELLKVKIEPGRMGTLLSEL